RGLSCGDASEADCTQLSISKSEQQRYSGLAISPGACPMSSCWKIPRRTVLRGIGVGLALPCLDIMRGISRAESAAAPPARLACLVQPNGVYPPAWEVSGEGRDYRLANILE